MVTVFTDGFIRSMVLITETARDVERTWRQYGLEYVGSYMYCGTDAILCSCSIKYYIPNTFAHPVVIHLKCKLCKIGK